jgi:hypothetical protein
MNHKRRRPKHQRAGCLWCKPHKDERSADLREPPAAARRMQESVPALTAEALSELAARDFPDRCGCGLPDCPWDAAGKVVD